MDLKGRSSIFALFIGSTLAAGAGGGAAGLRPAAAPSPEAAVLMGWPEASRLTATMLIEEYGLPDRSDSRRMVWHRRGRWERITLRRASDPPGGPVAPVEIEETVACVVPPDKFPALADFTTAVRVSQYGSMLSARSISEEHNYLKLNLSREIIDGKMGPSEARAVYAKTVGLAAAGKESPQSRALLFSPAPAPQSRWPIRFSLGHDRTLRYPLWQNEPSSELR